MKILTTKVLLLALFVGIAQANETKVTNEAKMIWNDIPNCKKYYEKYEPSKDIRALDFRFTDSCGNPREAILSVESIAQAYEIYIQTKQFLATGLLPKLPHKNTQYEKRYAKFSYHLGKDEVKIRIDATDCDGYSILIFKKIDSAIHIVECDFVC